MKRNAKNFPSGRRLILPALAVLILSCVSLPTGAEAAVKVRARIQTAGLRIALNSGGHRSGISVEFPARRGTFRVTKTDRKIARKLAKRTGYAQSDLLRLRRAGYRWNEIGHRLQIRPRLMRQVLQQARHGVRHDRRLDDRRPGRGSRHADPVPRCPR